ncbi:MAG TPA: hypothetical protein VHB25_15980 [Gemmatimonadaceae bacterium]|jgi:hypothetical protein|nr:hypothetical protein [Gemmatimonadaceae bacterium]
MADESRSPSTAPLASALAKAAADPGLALREKYQRILATVWRKPDNCPICDSSAWNLGDLVDVHVRGTPHPGTKDLAIAALGGTGPKVYVYIPVTCVYCGYTMFFHSGVLDVRDAEVVKAQPPLRSFPQGAK